MPDPYDVLTIAAIRDELLETVLNGRIQRLGLVDARTIGAEIYAGGQRRYLIASADERQPRLRLAAEMPSLDPALVTPFGLLLRKHVRGGVILDIDQPPLERLVRFSIAKRNVDLKSRDDAVDTSADDDLDLASEPVRDDDPAIVRVDLSVELMGRHSNLILIDSRGSILESAKRVTPAMSRVRLVLPRLAYTPPPPPARPDPTQSTPRELATLLSTLPADADLSRALLGAYRGLSPVVAREIVFRAIGENEATVAMVDAAAAAALAHAMQQVLSPLATRNWDPRLYLDDSGQIVAASPIPMTHLAADYDEAPTESMSSAIEAVEGARRLADSGRHVQRRQRLLAAVTAAREKAERRLTALANELTRAADGELFRRQGELIYAHLWEITPGQRELVVAGETIPLDPTLTPSENAQALFERYRKAQGAGSQIPDLVAQGQADVAYLDQLATLIAQAPGFAELEELAAEWAGQAPPNPGARPRRTPGPRRPKALTDAAGNAVYVGHTGAQNELLTFELAGPDDTWLHARGVGGSHVIIRSRQPGVPAPEETVAAAAALAAWYSGARDSSRVEVDVAPRRHVRKMKGGKPGMVTYRHERTIRVQPLPEERLDGVLRER